MAAIWDFLSEWYELCLIYKSRQCFLPYFKSIGPLVQGWKRKKEFQDGHHGGNFGFPIRMILAIFDHPDAWFRVKWPFCSGEEAKKKKGFQDVHHGGHLGFQIRTILAIFDQQVTQMLPTKFWVNWPFGSGEEAKNRYSKWPPWRPSWISDRQDFS